jgi:hypothetical protein
LEIREAANRGAVKNYKNVPPPSEENASISSFSFGQPLQSPRLFTTVPQISPTPPPQMRDSLPRRRRQAASGDGHGIVELFFFRGGGGGRQRSRPTRGAALARPELARGGAAALQDAPSSPLPWLMFPPLLAVEAWRVSW